MTAEFTLIAKPEMTLAEFLRMFDLSANRADQYDKPLEAREVGYLELVRTDVEGDIRARVRIGYRYDENFDITVTAEEVAIPK
jgi:hypothetical protein